MGVLNRAPMLFGSSRHFRRVREKGISVGTESAVEPFQKVQIFERSPIENEIIRTFDLWNSINREAYALIDSQKKIEQAERNDDGINDRRGHVRQDARLRQVGQEKMLEAPVFREDGFFEASFPIGKAILKFLFLFRDNALEFFLQSSNAIA